MKSTTTPTEYDQPAAEQTVTAEVTPTRDGRIYIDRKTITLMQ